MLDRADRAFAMRLVRGPHRRDLLPWIESRLRPDYLMRKPSPWLSLPAIRWLERFVRRRPRCRVFEYGSGGSTLFWLRRGCECTSVEHDEAWSQRVRAGVGAGAQFDLRFVPPEPIADSALAGGGFDPANPSLYQSSSPHFPRHQFRKYVEQIDDFPDGCFDVVLVDGRSRPSCLVHAANKVCVGGALILDNADRGHYLKNTLPVLAGYERTVLVGALPTLPTLNQTDVFVRER